MYVNRKITSTCSGTEKLLFADLIEFKEVKEAEDPEVDMFPLSSDASSVTNLVPAFGVTYNTSPDFSLRLVNVAVLVKRTSSPGRPFWSFFTTKSSSVPSKVLI